MANQEMITRRHLPHWYVPGAMHFVTFRLAGTLPKEVLEELKQRKETLLQKKPPPGMSSGAYRERTHKQLFAAYDKYLDKQRDIVWLSDPRIAGLVRTSLHHLHPEKYFLLAYTIMPNHVHVLFLPRERASIPPDLDTLEPGEADDALGPLSGIMHSLKSYTAHKANKILGRQGAFWQHESYDHWVRDEDELERIVAYINANPVTANLRAATARLVLRFCPRPLSHRWRPLRLARTANAIVGQASSLAQQPRASVLACPTSPPQGSAPARGGNVRPSPAASNPAAPDLGARAIPASRRS